MGTAHYVLDGSNLAYLGQRGKRPGERTADLRYVLAIAAEIAFNEREFVCYFDAPMPYEVVEDQRDLLAMLLGTHGNRFKTVHGRTRADDFALTRANADGATIVSHDEFGNEEKRGRNAGKLTRYREDYPWLDEAGRHIRPLLEGEIGINCPPMGVIDIEGATALGIYRDLLPYLRRPW